MEKYTDIYFIGIGGIGMSAIARYFKFKGYNVSGYDRTPSGSLPSSRRKVSPSTMKTGRTWYL